MTQPIGSGPSKVVTPPTTPAATTTDPAAGPTRQTVADTQPYSAASLTSYTPKQLSNFLVTETGNGGQGGPSIEDMTTYIEKYPASYDSLMSAISSHYGNAAKASPQDAAIIDAAAGSLNNAQLLAENDVQFQPTTYSYGGDPDQKIDYDP